MTKVYWGVFSRDAPTMKKGPWQRQQKRLKGDLTAAEASANSTGALELGWLWRAVLDCRRGPGLCIPELGSHCPGAARWEEREILEDSSGAKGNSK